LLHLYVHAAVSLAPRALYEEVAELLRQRIFRRELEPGSWIDEVKLAEEYGISRTPLREALKVLAAEGLVTMKVRRGAYVTEVSERDLADVYHLLSLLESDAAGVVAAQATDAQLKELQACTPNWKRPPATASASSPSTSASTCACWKSPTTAGATRWWPTCAR
jgi:DNA-binding GntR family transcriptional regulator